MFGHGQKVVGVFFDPRVIFCTGSILSPGDPHFTYRDLHYGRLGAPRGAVSHKTVGFPPGFITPAGPSIGTLNQF